MTTTKHSLIFLLFIFLTGLSSCQDDILYNPDNISDGEVKVNATIFFERFSNATLGKTSRSDGDAIKEVENVCILFYQENLLVKSLYGTVDSEGILSGDDISGTVDQTGNANRPTGDQNTSAENRTPSASLKFDIPTGKYKIYAVANLGNIATVLGESSSVDDLLSYKTNWEYLDASSNNSIAKNTNNQMLGYFNTDGSAKPFDQAPEITFGVTHIETLYCWLRRCASKVTVAFDATDMEANVKIYLKSVQILDIPRDCFLGKTNTPSSDDDLIHEGEKIYYCNEPDNDVPSDVDGWPLITRGKSYGLVSPDNEEKDSYSYDDYHSELSPALYFYENMQGEGKDKRQDADGDNNLDAPGLPGDPGYIAKDDIKYGTYIEVTAYYDRLGDKGKIIYRFMLGKDIYKDYNSERNHHYKLTLKFNGYANDVDWHIEYVQEKEIIVPDPYYISYLYNESVDLPIRIKGNDFSNHVLVAKIKENQWWPIHTQKENGEIKEYPVPSHPAVNAIYYPTANYQGNWYGFLSLAKNAKPTFSYGTSDGQPIYEPGDGVKVIGEGRHYSKDVTSASENWFKKVWEDRKNALNTREITDFAIGQHDDIEQGAYTVEKLSSGITVHLPYYTRQKQIMPTSGYTGNNPYEAYRRKAVVTLTLYKIVNDTRTKVSEQDVTIYQVRRCVNPKGIWRSYNNDEEFEVEMKILESEDATEFKSYESDGPWRASVEIGKDWIMLNGKVDGKVEGATDTYMNFTYKPAGVLTDPSKVRCGVILVEYNNYTCHHRIFVRQGYAPIEMNEGTIDGKPVKIKWHTQNLYSKTEETSSPLEEGSMFKFGNIDDGILASNNDSYGFQVAPGDFLLSNGESKKWAEIKANTGYGQSLTADTEFSFPSLAVQAIGTQDKSTCRVASSNDFAVLMNEPNRQYGYGVLYGDGATKTASKVEDVYGYTRNEGLSSTKGMRGCFVYNTQTGNQLFFPIGATGYGRRKTAAEWYKYTGGKQGAGKLQYAWRSELYQNEDELKYRPLFFDVYRRPGGIYWCNSITRNNNNITSTKNYLDVNYFTFEFTLSGTEPFAGYPSGTNTSTLDQGDSSAAFIRLVEDIVE